MALEIAAVQSPVISAIREQFGSLADARAELARVVPEELLNQIPGVNPLQPLPVNDSFAAALEVAEVLRDTDTGFFTAKSITTRETGFQAQLFARSIEVEGTQRLGSVAQTAELTAPRIDNAQQIQDVAQTQIPSAAETFNQLIGRMAYQNIQAVALPEPVVINPLTPKVTDEIKELNGGIPARALGSFGDFARNFEAFSSVQDFLNTISGNRAVQNVVNDVVSEFSSEDETELFKSRTSLIV